VLFVITTTLAVNGFMTKVINAGAVLNYLQHQDTIAKIRFDAITLHLNHISDSLRTEYENQSVFQTNYSNFVSSKTGSVKEWMKYMNGMQITLVPEPGEPTKSLEKSLDQPRQKFKMIIEKDTTKKK
ncbi:MAG: hypothetical protein PHQ91_15115, partial [Thermoanaerobaculaceae bacterium]|nr:hypothetical protein [Thermoanaerobaculaceae bacterium]